MSWEHTGIHSHVAMHHGAGVYFPFIPKRLKDSLRKDPVWSVLLSSLLSSLRCCHSQHPVGAPSPTLLVQSKLEIDTD